MAEQPFKCPVCGNEDPHAIGILNGKKYCRMCISFRGEEAENETIYARDAPINLSYELSGEQKELSERLVNNYRKGIDSLVFAVCGSGKTEICLEIIEFAIQKGYKVGFAVPRRSVCYELKCRFQRYLLKTPSLRFLVVVIEY